jgi:hypothetical protein
MIQPRPRQYFAATQRALAPADDTGWNDLPHVAAALLRRLLARRRWPRAARQGANDSHFQPTYFPPTSFGPAWDDTVATFDREPPAPRGDEPLAGVAVREVNEPEIFSRFFGPHPAGR